LEDECAVVQDLKIMPSLLQNIKAKSYTVPEAPTSSPYKMPSPTAPVVSGTFNRGLCLTVGNVTSAVDAALLNKPRTDTHHEDSAVLSPWSVMYYSLQMMFRRESKHKEHKKKLQYCAAKCYALW